MQRFSLLTADIDGPVQRFGAWKVYYADKADFCGGCTNGSFSDLAIVDIVFWQKDEMMKVAAFPIEPDTISTAGADIRFG